MTSLRRKQDLIALATILVAQLGLVCGVAQLVTGSVGWRELLLLVPGYVLTTLGVTLGYHRLLAHRALKVGKTTERVILSLGAMAGLGSPVMWVTNHRRHHAASDRDGDPHSPTAGFWHAHVLWLFRDQGASPLTHARDLLPNKSVQWVTRHYQRLMLSGLVIPALVGLILFQGQAVGLAQGLLWGGLVRLALNQHAIWSSGSLAHLFGKQRFKTSDQSRNNAFVALLALGEGWHNNHHAFPDCAYHGFTPGQVDVTGLVVAALGKCGLATDIKPVPSDEQQSARSLA